MGESILLVSTIVLVATLTSVLFVLLVQRRSSRLLSARLVEWGNTHTHSFQIWKIQQEKRMSEVEHSLETSVQGLETAWKSWEARDSSFIASTARNTHTKLLHTTLEQEIARIPYTDEVPLDLIE